MKKLANEVKDFMKSDKKKYVARPFNRFEPEDTVWWVTPGSDWPAYKYGKYMFRKYNDIIYIGLNIEKGYGIELSQMVSNNAIMTEEWIWHEFIEAAAQGEFNNTIESLAQNNSGDVHVLMGFGEFNQVDKESDYYADVFPNNITYIFKDNSIEAKDKEQNMRAEMFEKLKEAKGFQDIFKMMLGINGLSYFWVDLFIGVPFEIKDDDKELEIYKLDNQILSVLEKWIK